jgi:hypothetical protein
MWRVRARSPTHVIIIVISSSNKQAASSLAPRLGAEGDDQVEQLRANALAPPLGADGEQRERHVGVAHADGAEAAQHGAQLLGAQKGVAIRVVGHEGTPDARDRDADELVGAGKGA